MHDQSFLSAFDKEFLASLEKKLLFLCDLVTGVAKGFKTGLYLHGTGGCGKSYSVMNQLDKLDVSYRLYNSRVTAKGLFLTLQAAKDQIIVIEDCERLTKDPDAQGVLRSALWALPGHDRVVTWTTAADGEQRFIFRGGVILIANRPLAALPELKALATRIEVHRMEVSDAELAALMRQIALQGYKTLLAPEQCWEVTEYLLAECRSAGCPLDLRLQQKCFQTYLQCEFDWASTHWRDMVAASVREATHHFRYEADTAPREDKHKSRRNVIRELVAQPSRDGKKQEDVYAERTGCKHADFFRRKREVDSGEFDEYDAA